MGASPYAVWEVRSTGNDANGGFFDPTFGVTDYSQQNTAALSLSDVVSNGSNTITSATGGFTAAMVGNGIQIAGAFNVINGFQSANAVSLYYNQPSGTGQAAKVGGANATTTPFANNYTSSNTCWLRAATYAGPLALPGQGRYVLSGYGTTRGDNVKATIVATANNQVVVNGDPTAGVSALVANLLIDGAGYTGVSGMLWQNSRNACYRVRCQNCATPFTGTGAFYDSCEAIGGTTGFPGPAANCFADQITADYGFRSVATRCVARSCAAGGFSLDNNLTANNCVAYACPVGFYAGNVTHARNCLAVNCTSTGYACYVGGLAIGSYGYNNGSAYSGTFLVAPQTLSALPFVNPTATIAVIEDVWAAFALTPAAKAVLRGIGSPGNLDIGAVQSSSFLETVSVF